LNSRGIVVRFPAGARDSSSIQKCAKLLWGPKNELFSGYRGTFQGGKALRSVKPN